MQRSPTTTLHRRVTVAPERRAPAAHKPTAAPPNVPSPAPDVCVHIAPPPVPQITARILAPDIWKHIRSFLVPNPNAQHRPPLQRPQWPLDHARLSQVCRRTRDGSRLASPLALRIGAARQHALWRLHTLQQRTQHSPSIARNLCRLSILSIGIPCMSFGISYAPDSDGYPEAPPPGASVGDYEAYHENRTQYGQRNAISALASHTGAIICLTACANFEPLPYLQKRLERAARKAYLRASQRYRLLLLEAEAQSSEDN